MRHCAIPTTTANARATLLISALCLLPQGAASVNLEAPFVGLAGRWTGAGRVGFKDGKFEAVKCRATYFVGDDTHELKQNVRCAAAGAKIEVQSVVRHQAGRLSGTWSELVYNVTGDLTGEVTTKGYRVSVRSTDLAAEMEIIMKDTLQVVEVQFHHATLVGLNLVLEKG